MMEVIKTKNGVNMVATCSKLAKLIGSNEIWMKTEFFV